MTLTQVNSGGIKDATVATADLADQAVTLAKLEHGTSSNNGKFLRANNGADPTFETVNTDLVSDTSPQLGGDLQTNGNNINFPDNDILVFGTGNDLQIKHDGTKSEIRSATATNIAIKTAADFFVTHADTDGSNSENCIVARGDGEVELYYNGNKKLYTYIDGAKVEGDFVFKKADGTTKASWSGVGNRINVKDSTKFTAGDGDDLQIYHDSNGNNKITTSAPLTIQTVSGGEPIIDMTPNGAVSLYYDNAKKLETWAGGIKLNGVENAGSQIQIGASGDLALEHDGSHSYIGNTTGELRIQSDTLHLTAKSGGEPYLKGFVNDRVELYYDNIKKAQTSNVGLIIANTTDNADYTTALTLTRRGYETSNYGVRFEPKGGSAASQNGVRLKISDGSGSNYTSRFSFTHDGLLFNSDTAAANALDDYEEGTYTPAALSGGVGNNTDGQYTKIGNFCIVTGSINFDQNGSGMAGFTLPFTSASGRSGSGVIRYSTLGAADEITFHINTGNAHVSFYKFGGGSFTYSEASNHRFDFTLTYRTT